jgi:hypothetical protein
MAIDAMDLLFTESIDVFALVTSDSDFTPLVLKIIAKGKSVIGFGESKTPEPFKKACSLFIHTDGFGKPPDESGESLGGGERRSRNELRGDTELSNRPPPNLYELHARGRFWHRLAVLLESFNVKHHRALDELHDFVACFRGGYAAR